MSGSTSAFREPPPAPEPRRAFARLTLYSRRTTSHLRREVARHFHASADFTNFGFRPSHEHLPRIGCISIFTTWVHSALKRVILERNTQATAAVNVTGLSPRQRIGRELAGRADLDSSFSVSWKTRAGNGQARFPRRCRRRSIASATEQQSACAFRCSFVCSPLSALSCLRFVAAPRARLRLTPPGRKASSARAALRPLHRAGRRAGAFPPPSIGRRATNGRAPIWRCRVRCERLCRAGSRSPD